MAETTFSMFSAPESRGLQATLGLTGVAEGPQQLTEKYRPKTLGDMFGQGAAVWQLGQFVEAPYPVAFFFEGETGTGKTSAAKVLAHELGVDPNWSLHEIKSSEGDIERVSFAIKSLRFAAPGSGWKLVVVEEADAMSSKAKLAWLSALEELPDHSVIVFTTNHPDRFDARFRDRCEIVHFESRAELVTQDAQALFNRIWTAESISGEPVDITGCPYLVEAGQVSFRRVVRLVEQAKQGRISPDRWCHIHHNKTAPRTIKKTTEAVSPEVQARRNAAGRKAAETRRLRQAAVLSSTMEHQPC